MTTFKLLLLGSRLWMRMKLGFKKLMITETSPIVHWDVSSVGRGFCGRGFCFPCRVMEAPKRQNDSLVRGGFRNWKNAKRVFSAHEDRRKNPGHHDAVLNYQQLLLSKNHGDVVDQLHRQSDKASDDRNVYLQRISTATNELFFF